MILLDKPLVSDFVKDSIRQKKFMALDTGNMLEKGELNTLTEEEVIRSLRLQPNQRLHSISENAIAWIEENLGFTSLPEKIRLFKDKFMFRELLGDLYPELFYAKYTLAELENVDTASLVFPLIVKPNVGFFSMGVHKVFKASEWIQVVNKILDEAEGMKNIYPDAVLNTGSFIVEGCIEGSEFAVDAYYDEHGELVILGMMEHLFGGEEDVSDRVYLTSKAILKKNLHRFDPLLEEIGKRARLKNFSLHLELRVGEDGKAIPIEVNPLRFGAWCTSADLMNYAYGYNPYEYYIKGLKPDWDNILSRSDDFIYSINIFENSTPHRGGDIESFDYDGMLSCFSHPIELRKIDFQAYPIFGILFAKTSPNISEEIENILHAKMQDYVRLKRK